MRAIEASRHSNGPPPAGRCLFEAPLAANLIFAQAAASSVSVCFLPTSSESEPPRSSLRCPLRYRRITRGCRVLFELSAWRCAHTPTEFEMSAPLTVWIKSSGGWSPALRRPPSWHGAADADYRWQHHRSDRRVLSVDDGDRVEASVHLEARPGARCPFRAALQQRAHGRQGNSEGIWYSSKRYLACSVGVRALRGTSVPSVQPVFANETSPRLPPTLG